MANQIATYGKTAQQLISAGIQSSNRGVPAGSYDDDGINKYRWAYVTAAVKLGFPLIKKSLKGTQSLSIPAASFSQPATNATGVGKTYGAAAGDDMIRLCNFTGLTTGMVSNGKFNDGRFVVYSGTGIGSYPVNYVAKGSSSGFSFIKLIGGIRDKLSTGSHAWLVPNPYYGVSTPPTSVTVGSDDGGPAGFAVQSGAAGWQMIQTRGLGITRGSGVFSSGISLRMGLSRVSTIKSLSAGSCAINTNRIGIRVATSFGKAVAGTGYLPVDFCVE